MKKINIIVFLALLTIFSSCENDGGSSQLDMEIGAVPDFNKTDEYDAFIDFDAIETGQDFQIGFTINIAQGDVASADIIGFYQTGNNLYGPVVLTNSVNQFPNEVVLSRDDIVSSFSELSSVDDMLLADNLIISAKLYLSNGDELNILNNQGGNNYGADIQSSGIYTVKINYSVSCPSDLGGDYTVVSSGESTDPAPVNNPLVDFAYDVVITDNGGGSYTISDGVAGVYQDWYCDPYGYCFETPGSFTDVCGELSGSWTDGFGVEVRLTGVDNGNGTLSISWENDFGDFGDAEYTKQ